MAKKRLDRALVDEGLTPSRQRAQGAIAAGLVYVNGKPATKASAQVNDQDQLEVRGEALAYVSRGGLKLEKALESFSICLEDAIAMDCGASTGGFTDCMLQRGASKVYAIDVGSNQLVQSLRDDARVICMEQTNARDLTTQDIPDLLDFISIDVSFISLDKILPALFPLLKEGGLIVCLVKPQFEAGRERLGKNGVVKSALIHEEILNEFRAYAYTHGFSPQGLTFSPIRGPEGNIEYLALLEKSSKPHAIDEAHITRIVKESHEAHS